MKLIPVNLIRMSLMGGILILVIAAARALLLNRLPKKTFLVLWGVALFRLLIPYALPSEGSFYTFLERQTKWEGASDTGAGQSGAEAGKTGFDTEQSGSLAEQTASETGTGLTDDGKKARTALWLTGIWLAGAVCCLLVFGIISGRCIREFRMSLPVTDPRAREWLDSHPLRRKLQIRQTDRIGTPLTYGVRRPVILVPKTMDWADGETVKFVLEHEWTHIRHMDALWKLLVIAAVCLHWFNPLAWALYVLMNRDMELACDESVVRSFGEEQRGAYAMALLRMEERKGGVMPVGSNFGKNAVEERIGAIMKIRKVSVMTGTLAAVLVMGITSAFATSAVPAETEETAEMETLAEKSVFVEELVSDINQQILALEEQRDSGGVDFLEAESEIETLMEQREQLYSIQHELETMEGLLLDYGAYGMSAQVSLMDETGSILYLGSRPVRYLVDEEQEEMLWTDEKNGEIVVRVLRDEQGGVAALEEEDAETENESENEMESEFKTESETESGFENGSGGTISIIGGADGPTSIFFAGKLG